MARDEIKLIPFDFRNSDTATYAAATAFFNRMNAERLPDDPPHTLDENIAGWQSIPDFVHIEAWGVWRNADQTVVAAGSVDHLLTGQNEHAVEFAVEVLPEYRWQGLGTQLLRQIVEVTQRKQRSLMITNTDERIPAGALCVERLGARKGIENHTN